MKIIDSDKRFVLVVRYKQQDEGGSAIQKDLILFIGGYILLIIFVAVVLGQFNLVYHRVSETL